MRLVQRSITGRTFLVQFISVMQEFGREIPWLEPLEGLEFITNAVRFRDKLLLGLGVEEEEIISQQFLTSGRDREYFGGIIRFTRPIENFRDTRNLETQEKLTSSGFQYISCLQVRDIKRGQGYGSVLMKKALDTMKGEVGSVWGVTSRPELLPWYQRLGGQLLSPLENKDGLWLVAWPSEN